MVSFWLLLLWSCGVLRHPAFLFPESARKWPILRMVLLYYITATTTITAMTTTNFNADQSWELKVTPMLIHELVREFGGRISKADFAEDTQHGTDYFWHRKDRTGRLACRVRRAEFLPYKGDFTIREDRPTSGNKTELQKILDEEWADCYAYGFSDGQRILYYSIFRMQHFDPTAHFIYIPGFTPKDDSDTVTRAYSIAHQPAGFVFAQRDLRWTDTHLPLPEAA